jgi:outer membrane protein assembly factor BamB
VLRERTTVSCACFVLLVVTLLAVPVPVAVYANPPQMFPSEAAWTIDVKARPIVSPVASAGRVFIALQSGVHALRVKDHAEIWTQPLIADGPMAASADRLIVPSKGELHAFDAATGGVVWKMTTGPLTAPLFVDGDWVFVASGEQLSAYKASDGSKGWTRDDIGIIEERPAVMDEWIYVPVSDGRLVALDLASGERIWETHDVGIKPAEPLVYGDRVFIGSAAKRFCSFNIGTGVREWCSAIGAVIIGRPAADASNVYFVALDNQLHAHDRRDGERKWDEDLRYRPSSGPLLVGTSVTAPGKSNRLQTFDAATGKKADALVLPAELAQAPVLVPAGDHGPLSLAALVGDLQDLWKLTLAIPPTPPLPTLKIAPLTELPGLVVPLRGSRAPRG